MTLRRGDLYRCRNDETVCRAVGLPKTSAPVYMFLEAGEETAQPGTSYLYQRLYFWNLKSKTVEIVPWVFLPVDRAPLEAVLAMKTFYVISPLT